MRYAITVDVTVPRDQLVTLVDDPMALPVWHDKLVSVDPLEGEPGLEGSTTRLVYDLGGRPVEVISTVVTSDLPHELTTIACASGSCTETRHEFEALGDQATRWTQHVTASFTGPGIATFGAIMPGALARLTRRQMRALKVYAEETVAPPAAWRNPMRPPIP